MNLPINPEGLPPARGFSHGMLSRGGEVLHIAGETGHHEDLTLDDDFVAQFGQACRNVSAVVVAAGGTPSDIASLTIFVTDVSAYRDNLGAIGEAYREAFGRHFPAMALIGITELVDPKALVEITGVAVIPSRS
ncbi:MAG TPA: RidA family protein [Acidimicrobiia bacterium]